MRSLAIWRITLAAATIAGVLALSSASLAVSAAVSIDTFRFVPAAVSVGLGDSVTWTNRDAAPHTATAPGAFDTGPIPQGQSRAITMTAAGTFAYRCSIHPTMSGTVQVLGTTAPTAAPTAPPPAPTAPPTTPVPPTPAPAAPRTVAPTAAPAPSEAPTAAPGAESPTAAPAGPAAAVAQPVRESAPVAVAAAGPSPAAAAGAGVSEGLLVGALGGLAGAVALALWRYRRAPP